MPKFGIQVEVVVRRTYIAEALLLDEAVDKVQTILDTGNYDDTDESRWSSSGAEIVGYKLAPHDAEVDPEVS